MKLRLVPLFLAIVALPAMAGEGYGPLIRSGLEENLAIGADLFFSETFNGNGRTCGTCHIPTENYTLPFDLSTVDEQSPLMVGDPNNPNFFVPELELCDQDVNSGEDCQAIRVSGLILENVDGDNVGHYPDVPPTLQRSYSMRSVPHLLSMKTSIDSSGAGEAVGWSGDGAPNAGTLRDFATGAVRQHFTRSTARILNQDFREPNGDELDAMRDFQLALGRMNDIDLATFQFLDNLAMQARDFFNDVPEVDPGQNTASRCARCHANAGARADSGFNDNFDTHIEEARNQSANCPNGTPGQCAKDSGDLVAGANEDGGRGLNPHPVVSFKHGDGTFNPPPLIEAADTGPFFHDNRNNNPDLDFAISFYRDLNFLASPACDTDADPNTDNGIALCGLLTVGGPGETFGQEFQLSGMLRILNAGLNVSMAAQRLNATINLLAEEAGNSPSVIKELTLAHAELEDAWEVLDPDLPRSTFALRFQNNNGHIHASRTDLLGYLSDIDDMIANGTASTLAVAQVVTQLVGTAETHLSPDFYDEGTNPANCSLHGITPATGAYHDCRWIYDLGEANLIYDNKGVEPSVDTLQTSLTWTPYANGATLAVRWVTDEWTNPLFESTVLTDLGDPGNPVTFDSVVTPLANGQYERSYSHDVTCIPNRQYTMTGSARVGGVTETAVQTVSSPTLKPGGYSAVTYGGYVGLAWNAASWSCGGGSILYYEIERKPFPSGTSTFFTTGTTNFSDTPIPDQWWQYRVRTVTDTGAGQWTAWKKVYVTSGGGW